MNEIDIIRAVIEEGYQISPQAVELIKLSNSPENLLKYILSTIDDCVFVIEPEHVDLKSFEASTTFSRVTSGAPPGTVSGKVSGKISTPALDSASEPVSDSGYESSSEPSVEPDIVSAVEVSDSNPEIEPEILSSQGSNSDFDSDPVYDSASDLVHDLAKDPIHDSVSAPVNNSVHDSVHGSFSNPVSPSVSPKSIEKQASSFFGITGPSSTSKNALKANFLFSNQRNSLSSSSRDEGVRYIPGRNPVTVLSDITGHSTCVGEYMQFVQYFRDRYSRLSEILRGRMNARPVESLKRRSFRRGSDGNTEELSIIGMVSDISTTTNGHKILSLEDSTGSFSVLIRNSDKELFELASRLLLDEVVGVTGSVTNDGNLMLATKLLQPDVPNSVQRRTGSHGKAVLISDVHVGSSQFLEDSWLDFLDFLKGESDSEEMREIAAQIRYLVVAGDLVDGIGIYPDQEMELDIPDVYEQYRKAAEYIREVPEQIHVIISPGNHDAVRQAEPQPALPARICADFPENVTFVGNPALVDLDGVQILIYHGRSIDDLVASVPGVSYQEPAGAVLEMLKRRHLAPTYGSRVSISPEKKDYFIIDPVPDIIHTGHVHTLGVQRYKNVLLVNSGTWQGQTEFQKRVNLMPMPARVPVVDLANFDVKILAFD
ncbi:Archaeal DNA polymerase II small subunit [Methanosarcina siciliae HI350]|uniref:DNA polymerase II small subunit n=1 Tax=Methanosarcina siciliae HI350 TaxID=1434119 RepID=A0A0E3PIV0_9EURY|nr:DNA-directed DNA polymerase II small subunit [Methanosarcina siciliae]AKB34548.1 Archaeal DNA polymerase II small subunit [Methanosarcina siciliae HI350]